MVRLQLLWGKLRRYWLCKFHRDYVKRQIALRTGECRQCGTCCDLGFRCPFLKSDDKCRVYYSRLRPKSCIAFPIDERDIQDVKLAAGCECGYSFGGDRVPEPQAPNPE